MAALGATNPTNWIVSKDGHQKIRWFVCSNFIISHPNQMQKFFLWAKQILNLVLANREARHSAPSGTNSPVKTHWATLCAARENLEKISESQILVRLYNEVRTHFVENS
jgi:hypothetical protein